MAKKIICDMCGKSADLKDRMLMKMVGLDIEDLCRQCRITLSCFLDMASIKDKKMGEKLRKDIREMHKKIYPEAHAIEAKKGK